MSHPEPIRPYDVVECCSCGGNYLRWLTECPKCGASVTIPDRKELRHADGAQKAQNDHLIRVGSAAANKSQAEHKITLTIPEIAISANKLYSGMHHTKRKRIVDEWHALVIEQVRQQGIKPYSGRYPVSVMCRCYFGVKRRIFDADNLFPTGKLTIDALVLRGILPGDSPEFVGSVTFVPARSQNRKSYTVITVEGMGESLS